MISIRSIGESMAQTGLISWTKLADHGGEMENKTDKLQREDRGKLYARENPCIYSDTNLATGGTAQWNYVEMKGLMSLLVVEEVTHYSVSAKDP